MEKKENSKKTKKFTRYSAMLIVSAIMIAVIAIKLASIQIVHGEEYRVQAMDNSIRTVEDSAPRGKIKDRNGIDLATNDQIYSVFMMQPQEEFDDLTLMRVIERLIDILDKHNEKIKDDFPITVKYGLNGEYEYSFEFQNNYTNEIKIQEYNVKAAAKWKKDNNIPESFDARQTFEYLKNKGGKYKYDIKPEQESHNNAIFIRRMMAVRQKIEDMGYKLYKPVEIACVSKETAIEMMEMGLYLPGVDYSIKSVREYPFGEMAANIIGSLRKIPAERVSEYKDKHYDINTDLVGRDGIELYAEDDLKGEKGARTVRVDNLGRIVGELGKSDPIPGNNIVLTIDKNLQMAAESVLDNIINKLVSGELRTRDNNICIEATRAAAVVIDVRNGEVLAMASRPGGYDPNLMAATGGISSEDWGALNPSEEGLNWVERERLLKPMYNYATMGAVPPGSTFKMITAIAGLETRKVTPWESIYDKGVYEKYKFNGKCWLWNLSKGKSTHGYVNLKKAIQVSCNYYFFELGDRVGLENLCRYARMFGLSGEPTGIEIAENPGDAADEAIKERYIKDVLSKINGQDSDGTVEAFNLEDEQKQIISSIVKSSNSSNKTEIIEKLKEAGINNDSIIKQILRAREGAISECGQPGMVLTAAIGQGDNSFTPLQIANYIATLANGGVRYRPHLVKQILKPDGTVVKDVKPEIMQEIKLKPTTIASIKDGMNAVVDDGGTAHSAFNGFPVKVAGKTGTAEAVGLEDYSWFSGYAPVDNPEIAVAVVIHEGRGLGAAEAARDIFAQYFKDYIEEE